MSTTDKTPPQHLVDLCAKMLKQNDAVRASPYLLDDEFGDDWRLQLEVKLPSPAPSVWVNYLQPQYADWHTYYIFAEVIKSAYAIGLSVGKDAEQVRLSKLLFGRTL